MISFYYDTQTYWTRHIQHKMRHYALSKQRIRRVIKSPDRKKIYKNLSKQLIAFCNGAKQNIKPNQKWFRDTLAYKLQESFDTMSLQFKLHSCMTVKENEDLAWDIFERSIKIIRKGFSNLKYLKLRKFFKIKLCVLNQIAN